MHYTYHSHYITISASVKFQYTLENLHVHYSWVWY